MAVPDRTEQAIFDVARHLPATVDRRSYMEHACGDDRNFRARVEALLRVHDEDPTFLESPANGVQAGFADTPEGPGTVIGPYTLLRQLGEGGMGTVYLAEQARPVRRQVALKILKPGLDARILARFEAERQALALMSHPHIATVLDAGTIEECERPVYPRERRGRTSSWSWSTASPSPTSATRTA